MQNFLWISGLVGAGLPFVIALVNQSHWKAGLKASVAFILCFIAALLTTWIEGKFNTDDVIASVLVVFTVARASYAGLWRPTGAAPALEESTTIKST